MLQFVIDPPTHLYIYLQSSAITSIMAQFDIDPYRWPGWMHATLAAAYCLLVLFCFTETRPWVCAKVSCNKCSPHSGLQLSVKLQSNWKIRFLVSTIYLHGNYGYNIYSFLLIFLT